MPKTKVAKPTRSELRAVQREALIALHERGHYSTAERQAGIEANRCLCGGFTTGVNLLCHPCAKRVAIARRKGK
jgi:hypothetical protein